MSEGTSPESASQFFLSQTEPEAKEAQTELLDIQERCLLLGFTAHWLSLLSPAPLDKLESLEKKLWINRVRQRVLTFAMEKESVFNLAPAAVTPGTNTYEELIKEFSFSNIPGLNTETCLSLDGLPAAPQEQMEANAHSELNPEERGVLTALIDQLLDNGCIHEASRVCRYFSLHHPDVWVVLRCQGLASGKLNPEPQDEFSEAPQRSSFTSCK